MGKCLLNDALKGVLIRAQQGLQLPKQQNLLERMPQRMLRQLLVLQAGNRRNCRWDWLGSFGATQAERGALSHAISPKLHDFALLIVVLTVAY